MIGVVDAVAAGVDHGPGKPLRASIAVVAGRGVEGDAHFGATVQHRSRVARNPAQPNLRQVHLIHGELLDGLVAAGFAVGPGTLGENVTTRGLPLLELPTGTRLAIGDAVVLALTGLRNPCAQLDGVQRGLMAAVLDRGPDGSLVRKAGVMAVVEVGGVIRPGDPIQVHLPDGPRVPLAPI